MNNEHKEGIYSTSRVDVFLGEQQVPQVGGELALSEFFLTMGEAQRLVYVLRFSRYLAERGTLTEFPDGQIQTTTLLKDLGLLGNEASEMPRSGNLSELLSRQRAPTSRQVNPTDNIDTTNGAEGECNSDLSDF